jgi:hypothetical protein
VLVCSERKVLLAGYWWLVCSDWWLISQANKDRTAGQVPTDRVLCARRVWVFGTPAVGLDGFDSTARRPRDATECRRARLGLRRPPRRQVSRLPTGDRDGTPGGPVQSRSCPAPPTWMAPRSWSWRCARRETSRPGSRTPRIRWSAGRPSLDYAWHGVGREPGNG